MTTETAQIEVTRPGWWAEIDGTHVPLRMTLDAIELIEAMTGRTLYQHAEAAKDRAVPLRHLAIILCGLAGPESPIAEIRAPASVCGVSLGLGHQEIRAAEAVVLRHGIIEILAQVMVPIVIALRRGADEHGAPRAPADAGA